MRADASLIWHPKEIFLDIDDQCRDAKEKPCMYYSSLRSALSAATLCREASVERFSFSSHSQATFLEACRSSVRHLCLH